VVKPRSEFRNRDPKQSRFSRQFCATCEDGGLEAMPPDTQERVRRTNRATSLRRWFGITVEQYEALNTAQGGVCKICGGTETGRLGYLYVDHCHDSKVIRGLLCRACNHAIGLMRDDPAILRAAAVYLEGDFSGNPVATPGLPSGRRS